MQSADTRFVTFVHEEKEPSLRLQAWQNKNYRKLLINRIFELQWSIAYSIAHECSSAEIKVQLETAMRQVLRQWLRPLKKISSHAVVDNFVFTQLQTSNKYDNEDDEHERAFSETDIDRLAPHLQVIFYCEEGRSYMYRWSNEIHMFPKSSSNKALHIGDTHYSRSTLLHEVGHAFGLSDTYVESETDAYRSGIKSTGGLEKTVGKQPLSVMSGLSYVDVEPDEDSLLGDDDISGIKWLYRYFHQKDTSVETCPNDDYEFEIVDSKENISGCRPRYPLIFEVKQGHIEAARWLIRNAFDVEINAQDRWGNTALHYAAAYDYCYIIRDLLAKSNIYREATNNEERTPLHYAEEREHRRVAALLRGEKGARCKISKSLCASIGLATNTEPAALLVLLLLPLLLCVQERCSRDKA